MYTVDITCKGKVIGSIPFTDFQILMERLNAAFPFKLAYQTYDDSIHIDESIILDVLFGNY